MKIRIKGNSLRIRLTRLEVDYFGRKHCLEEKINFKTNALVYALKGKPDINELAADFSDNAITMYVPEHFIHEWTSSEKIGYANEMETGDGKKLYLLLEKDFKCLDNIAEDQSDNYINPLAVK